MAEFSLIVSMLGFLAIVVGFMTLIVMLITRSKKLEIAAYIMLGGVVLIVASIALCTLSGTSAI